MSSSGPRERYMTHDEEIATARPFGREEVVYQAVLDGRLQVDERGRVWRAEGRRGERPAHGGKYWRVTVSVKGRLRNTLSHRLVWFHTYGRIPDGLVVNHRDGNGLNNDPQNLELVTHGENSKHRYHILGRQNLTKEVVDRGRRDSTFALRKSQAYRRMSPQAGLQLDTLRQGALAAVEDTTKGAVYGWLDNHKDVLAELLEEHSPNQVAAALELNLNTLNGWRRRRGLQRAGTHMTRCGGAEDGNARGHGQGSLQGLSSVRRELRLWAIWQA